MCKKKQIDPPRLKNWLWGAAPARRGPANLNTQRGIGGLRLGGSYRAEHKASFLRATAVSTTRTVLVTDGGTVDVVNFNQLTSENNRV